MNALVSVIMPIFNSQKYIRESIESVLSQSYSNLELLAIDDCSTDNSVAIVQELMVKDNRLKLVRQAKNCGAAAARNEGIRLSQGKYIAFLDSDDIWASDKLQKQIKFMVESRAQFSFTAYQKISETGGILGRVGAPERIDYRELLKTCKIGCLTAIYDAESLGKVLMPSIRKRQDFGLWLKLLKMTPYAAGLNESLAFYRVRHDSISSNKIGAAKYTWKLYREVERLPLHQCLWYFSHYSIRGIMRLKLPGLSRKLGILD
jgi:glycosyltransferase involved in cell wall biosynthesis